MAPDGPHGGSSLVERVETSARELTVTVAMSCTQVHGTAFSFCTPWAGELTNIDRRGLTT